MNKRWDKNRNNRKQIVQGNHSLARVHKYFPNIEKIVDATESIQVEVTKKDLRSASKKDPKDCALARACKREKNADGAIIGISTSYIIKGNTATRYMTSTSIAREIVSFDRHGDFYPGKAYTLSSVPLSLHLRRGRKIKSVKRRKVADVVHQHRTANIRTL